MNELAIRDLAASVVLRAVKDYFKRRTTPEQRAIILKDLRSSWMNFFTNGISVNVAEQLEKHPKEIRARLREHANEEEL